MAEDISDLTEEEMEILAYTLLGEAGAEGPEGMEAVMHVINNRARSGRYPNNPAAVALQKMKGTYQFSTWSPKHGNSPISKFKKSSKEFQEALDIVQTVLSGESVDPTGSALHYYASKGGAAINEPGWFKGEAKGGAVQIGGHKFAATTTPSQRVGVSAAASRAAAPQPRAMPPTVAAYRSAVATRAVDYGLPATAAQLRNVVGSATRPQGPTTRRSARPKTVMPTSGLTTRVVSTVPINPLTGMPEPRPQSRTSAPGAGLTPVQRAAMASTAKLAPRAAASPSGGVTRTAGGIAGTVAMPRGVVPASVRDSGLMTASTVPRGPTGRGRGRKPATAPRPPPAQPTREQVEAATGFRFPRSTALPAAASPAPPHDPSKRLPEGKPLAIATPRTKTVFVTETIKIKNPDYKGSNKTVGPGVGLTREQRNAMTSLAGTGLSTVTPIIDPVTVPEFIEKQIVVKKQVPLPPVKAPVLQKPLLPQQQVLPPPPVAIARPVQRVTSEAEMASRFSAASEAALAADRRGYVAGDGSVMPTTTISGKKRYTYGDPGGGRSEPVSGVSWWG